MSLPLPPLIPSTPVLKTTTTYAVSSISSSSTPPSLLMPTTESPPDILLLGPPRLAPMKKNRLGNKRSKQGLGPLVPLVSKNDDKEEEEERLKALQRNKKRSFLLSTAPLVPDASLEDVEEATNGTTISLLPSCRLRMRPTKKIARTPIPYPSELLFKAPRLRTSTTSASNTRRDPLQLDPSSLPAGLMFPDIPTTTSSDELHTTTTSSSSNRRPRFTLKPKPLKRTGEATSTTSNEGLLLAA